VSLNERRVTKPGSLGLAIVLIGAGGFLVGCFLPYSNAFLPGERSLSFFRQMVALRSTLADLAGYVQLFVPVAIVGVTAGIGLLRPRLWTVPAAIAASTVWSLTWLGSLLSVIGFLGPLRYGFWFMVVSVVAVVVGAVLLVLSTRRGGAVEDGSESEPVPALRP
jgi:hypothetical protein